MHDEPIIGYICIGYRRRFGKWSFLVSFVSPSVRQSVTLQQVHCGYDTCSPGPPTPTLPPDSSLLSPLMLMPFEQIKTYCEQANRQHFDFRSTRGIAVGGILHGYTRQCCTINFLSNRAFSSATLQYMGGQLIMSLSRCCCCWPKWSVHHYTEINNIQAYVFRVNSLQLGFLFLPRDALQCMQSAVLPS